MEELWKDIAVSTPLSHAHHHLRLPTLPTSSPSYRSIIVQDFLASTAMPQPPSLQPQPPPPPSSLPPTALSLSSSLEFTYLGGSPYLGPQRSNSSSGDDSRDGASGIGVGGVSSFMPPPLSDAFAAPGNIFSFGPKKRGPDGPGGSSGDGTGGDRRHRRMIKNRESAARSRARKLAYTNELELSVKHLQHENEMLKKQQEELTLRLAMAAQMPARPTVQRCRSSPL